MKASIGTTQITLMGEEGNSIVVVFSGSGDDLSAHLVFCDEWKEGRAVELDKDELQSLQDVLSVPSDQFLKKGAFLKLSDGNLDFTVRSTNRGEPYRDGFQFNLEKNWEGFPIFVELDDCRDFARLLAKTLSSDRRPSFG